MDVFSSGPNTGNLVVTAALVLALLVMSSRAKMLDTKGANAAAILGLVVGGLGHWTWLLILLGFRSVHTKPRSGDLTRRKPWV